MVHSLPPGGSAARGRQVVVLTRHAEVAAAAHAACAELGLPSREVESGSEALARLARPGPAPAHLICDPEAAGAAWSGLLATLAEPATRTHLVLVGRAPATYRGSALAAPVAGNQAALARALAAPRDTVGRFSAESGSLAALKERLARDEIGVHYQPVVRLSDRRPVMVEALARWQGPGTPIPPQNFVALAERSGLVRPLSDRVARRAAAEIARLWPRLRLGVSINLSLDLLLQPDLSSWLRRVLGRQGLGPRQVALELTETTPVCDVARLHRILIKLRASGFRVLLDDVSPYDNRGHLHELPFHGLKLDRSLIEQLPHAGLWRRQVRHLSRAAEARGQVVIAEGVSDRRIWSALRALGVHYAQGYEVGRPLPAPALTKWWDHWRSGRWD